MSLTASLVTMRAANRKSRIARKRRMARGEATIYIWHSQEQLLTKRGMKGSFKKKEVADTGVGREVQEIREAAKST